MPKDSLKDKVEGNELDISLSQLTTVPVRELSLIPKATHLDLSCNLLTSLPSDFPQLVHIVKLDLSKNSLTSLPENFGSLQKLQFLDLFSNQLTTVPLSFCFLKNLRWLDLKDNKLVEPLNSVAGDCLDDMQCKRCAKNVVAHMKKLESDREREHQKQLTKQRELEAIKKAEEDKEKAKKRAEKKAEKEKRKKMLEQMAAERQEQEEAERLAQKTEKQLTKGSKTANGHMEVKLKEKSGFGCCGVFLAMLIGLAAVALGLYFYCESNQKDLYCRRSKALMQQYYEITKKQLDYYYDVTRKQVELLLKK